MISFRSDSPANESPNGRPLPPWFELLKHKLTPEEIEEIHLCAQEKQLTVHQWMDVTIRSAGHQMKDSTVSSAPSNPTGFTFRGLPGN